MKVDPLDIIWTEPTRIHDDNEKVSDLDPDLKTGLQNCLIVPINDVYRRRKRSEATVKIIKE